MSGFNHLIEDPTPNPQSSTGVVMGFGRTEGPALFEQRLYGRTKRDQLKLWDIIVTDEDGVGVIHIAHRTGEDGAPTLHREEVREGKNLGRANATTPIEQALAQAKSRVMLQLDRGYKEEIPPPGERTNALGYPMPMLATPLEKIKGELGEHWYVQPKLDGFRCLAFKDDDGEVHLYTRRGKRVETLPHLVEIYEAILEPGDHVDGELYAHGLPLQKIASLVKRQQDESAQICHYLYDLVSEHCYSERGLRVMEIANRHRGPEVEAVTTAITGSLETTEAYFHAYREQGYEGAILRLLGEGYEVGARSRNLVKMKGFEEADFRVIGVERGKPKHKNGEVLEVPVLVCVTEAGHEFKVTAPGDEREKHELWFQKKRLVHSFVEVKFSNRVKKTGIPFHPVATKIKDEELD